MAMRRTDEAVDEAFNELLMLSEYLQYVQRNDKSGVPNAELTKLINALSAITKLSARRPGLPKYLN